MDQDRCRHGPSVEARFVVYWARFRRGLASRAASAFSWVRGDMPTAGATASRTRSLVATCPDCLPGAVPPCSRWRSFVYGWGSSFSAAVHARQTMLARRISWRSTKEDGACSVACELQFVNAAHIALGLRMAVAEAATTISSDLALRLKRRPSRSARLRGAPEHPSFAGAGAAPDAVLEGVLVAQSKREALVRHQAPWIVNGPSDVDDSTCSKMKSARR